MGKCMKIMVSVLPKSRISVGVNSSDMISVRAMNGVIKEVVYDGYETFSGPYDITPKAQDAQIMNTKDKVMTENVTIQKIPFYETSNDSGQTVYIGSELR